MEVKKNKIADLEKKKIALFFLGLVASLSISLSFIEAKVAYVGDSELPVEKSGLEDEEIIEVQMEQEIVPPPPPPPPPPEPEIIEIVEDEEDVVETEIEAETEADEEIEIIEEEAEPVIEEVFTVVEKMPSFPGGEEKLYEYLGQNIKYPQMAKEAGVKGKVYVQFVVEKDGSITDVTVARGIGSGCDKEAVRVVKKMPRWSPGEQRGKKVRVKYTLPVVYQLR